MSAINKYQKEHALYAKRIRPLFLNALALQLQPAIDFILETGLNPDLDLVIRPGYFINPMQNAYEIVGTTAAKREYYGLKKIEEKANIDFLISAWKEILRMYALRYAYRIDNELTDTTKELIRQAILEADEQGLNADKKATYIRKKVLNEITRTRATLIAVTEATTASNLGKLEGAKSYFTETGQKGYKQWIGRDDGRERPSHLQMNDDIIPFEDQWILSNPDGGVSTCNAPGDVSLPANERCRCRCTQIFMTERRYQRMLAEKK